MDKMAQIISSDNLFETLVFVLSAGSWNAHVCVKKMVQDISQ